MDNGGGEHVKSVPVCTRGSVWNIIKLNQREKAFVDKVLEGGCWAEEKVTSKDCGGWK
jgi:hypothetical protein